MLRTRKRRPRSFASSDTHPRVSVTGPRGVGSVKFVVNARAVEAWDRETPAGATFAREENRSIGQPNVKPSAVGASVSAPAQDRRDP